VPEHEQGFARISNGDFTAARASAAVKQQLARLGCPPPTSSEPSRPLPSPSQPGVTGLMDPPATRSTGVVLGGVLDHGQDLDAVAETPDGSMSPAVAARLSELVSLAGQTDDESRLRLYVGQLELLRQLGVLRPGARLFNPLAGADLFPGLYVEQMWTCDRRLSKAWVRRAYEALRDAPMLRRHFRGLPNRPMARLHHSKRDVLSPSLLDAWAQRMRPGDVVWLKVVVEYLKAYGATAERIEAWIQQLLERLPDGVLVVLFEEDVKEGQSAPRILPALQARRRFAPALPGDVTSRLDAMNDELAQSGRPLTHVEVTRYPNVPLQLTIGGRLSVWRKGPPSPRRPGVTGADQTGATEDPRREVGAQDGIVDDEALAEAVATSRVTRTVYETLRSMEIGEGRTVLSIGPGGPTSLAQVVSHRTDTAWEAVALAMGARVIVVEPYPTLNMVWGLVRSTWSGGDRLEVVPRRRDWLKEPPISPRSADMIVSMAVLSDVTIEDPTRKAIIERKIDLLRSGGYLIVGWRVGEPAPNEMIKHGQLHAEQHGRSLKEVGRHESADDPHAWVVFRAEER
jgi:hypothetical protein